MLAPPPIRLWILATFALGLIISLVPLRSGRREALAGAGLAGPATATVREEPAREYVPPFTLPPVPQLVGRADELRTILEMLRDPHPDRPRVVVLYGDPGVGKTALAVRAAHAAAKDFQGGVLFADLQGQPSTEATASACLAGFIEALQAGEPAPTSYPERRWLYRALTSAGGRGAQVLIVLDGIDSFELASRLLPVSARCGVLVTSRMRPPDEFTPLAVKPLTIDSSVQLFCELVGLPLQAYRHNESTLDIARRTAGYPLALQLTGAALASRRYWSLERIARTMNQLAPHAGGADARHRALDLCYAMLSDDERRTLTALGLLDSSVLHPWMLVAIQADDDRGPADDGSAARLCERLVDVRLLERVADATGVVVFRVPEHVLDYARALWVVPRADEDQSDAQHRFARARLEARERIEAARGGRQEKSPLNVIRRDVYRELEKGDLTKSLDYARDALLLARDRRDVPAEPPGSDGGPPAEQGDNDGEGLAVAALAEVLAELGGADDAREMARIAARSTSHAVRARAGRCQGRLLWRQRRLDEAIAELDRARVFAEQAGDGSEDIRIRRELAIAHAYRGDLAEADGLLQDVDHAHVPRPVRAGLVPSVEWARSVVLLEVFDASDKTSTQALVQVVAALDIVAGASGEHQLWRTWAVLQRARVERRRRHYADARTLAVAALDQFAAMRHRYGTATCRWEIGAIYLDQQRYTDALAMLEEARRIFSTCGDRWIEATVAVDLARAQRLYGHLVEAQRTLEQAGLLFGAAAARDAGPEPRRAYEAFQSEVEALFESIRRDAPTSLLAAGAASGGPG